MISLAEIQEDFSKSASAAFEAAFEAGRVQGRKEALAELQTHMAGFFQMPTQMTTQADSGVMSDIANSANEGRAAPGSVKPVVHRMLKSAPNGLTTSEIAGRGGFKFNSVRGTLWALGQEGHAENRDGRWFAILKTEEADEEPEPLSVGRIDELFGEASKGPPAEASEPLQVEGRPVRRFS